MHWACAGRHKSVCLAPTGTGRPASEGVAPLLDGKVERVGSDSLHVIGLPSDGEEAADTVPSVPCNGLKEVPRAKPVHGLGEDVDQPVSNGRRRQVALEWSDDD